MTEFVWVRVTDEKLIAHLDRLFPDHHNREPAYDSGRHFRRRYSPSEKALDVVRQWDKYLEENIRTDDAPISAKLDHNFPNAGSNAIVEFEGNRYQRKYRPVKSRSGRTIHYWEKWWMDLGPIES